jgi:hypothetical protein
LLRSESNFPGTAHMFILSLSLSLCVCVIYIYIYIYIILCMHVCMHIRMDLCERKPGFSTCVHAYIRINLKIHLQEHTKLKERVKVLESEKAVLDKQKRALEQERAALQVCYSV